MLSLHNKVNIIQCLRNGDSIRMLADKYGVGTSTISDIKKKKSHTEVYLRSGQERWKLMKPQHVILEDAVFT